jgi:hypothetical protein
MLRSSGDFAALPPDVRKGCAFPISISRKFEAAPRILPGESEA